VRCGVEEGVVFMGVAFRELPVRRSQRRLPQSRDRGLQGSAHYGYCVHGSHLLSTDHDRQDASTPAARVRNRYHADCRVTVERAADRYTLICDALAILGNGRNIDVAAAGAESAGGQGTVRITDRNSTDEVDTERRALPQRILRGNSSALNTGSSSRITRARQA
jgi:hypothetical protein